MADKKQETVADIVAQIRAAAYIQNADSPQSVLNLANRLEAAHRREMKEARTWAKGEAEESFRAPVPTAEKSSAVGNAAKLREALEYISQYADCAATRQHDEHTTHYIEQIRLWAKAALAAPARNCDVGTAEEQYERYRKRCGAQDCCDCPVRARWDFKQTGSESCQLVWAQMPYEEGGEK